ncbi:hypothetical protein BGW38_004910 [Lunasporangiospora selenospora]|uniref:Uncharacterized protein n=1 Tax=Lunasporangiospora selenospora TaxID=979761 RepID=A0A9P6FPI2_9FUNG|nr:hypothetical protein BGW38_004910 [Lunasporangiospora selenospora]
MVSFKLIVASAAVVLTLASGISASGSVTTRAGLAKRGLFSVFCAKECVVSSLNLPVQDNIEDFQACGKACTGLLTEIVKCTLGCSKPLVSTFLKENVLVDAVKLENGLQTCIGSCVEPDQGQ